MFGLTFLLIIAALLIYTRPPKEEYTVITPEEDRHSPQEPVESTMVVFGNPIKIDASVKEFISIDISPDESTLVTYLGGSPDRSARRLVVDLKTNEVVVSPKIYTGYPNSPEWINGNKYVTYTYGTEQDQGHTLAIEDLKSGEISEIPLSNFSSRIHSFLFNEISPDGTWVTNGLLDFFDIKGKRPLSIPGPDEDTATLWFSDSKRILGCHNSQFTIWNIETGQSQTLVVDMPDNTLGDSPIRLVNCTSDLIWLIQDKVVVGNFYYNEGESEDPVQDWVIVDLEKSSTIFIPDTKILTTDTKTGLAVAVWNRYNANGSSGIPHVTLYDRNGTKLKEKVFDIVPGIETNRYNISLIDRSHVFYWRLTDYDDNLEPARMELVVLDLDTGIEKVIGGSLNYDSGQLLSDKNTWIATSGNELIKGKIDETK